MSDEFEAVRAEEDPILQARRAGELIALYRQRSFELARLRRDAINRAAQERGLTFTAVGEELDLTRGRISQIRKDAPPTERAFFGVGPIVVATPTRAIPGRPEGGVSREDAEADRRVTELLHGLAFEVTHFAIPPDGRWTPRHEAVVICGPKSSSVTADIIEHDPLLDFRESGGRWRIIDSVTGQEFTSPMDDDGGPATEDVAYVGRVTRDGLTTLVLAGVHALGSVGAVAHVGSYLADLHAAVGMSDFSMVVRSSFDGLTPLTTEAVWGPTTHR